jgi:hypothetical protein
MRARSLVRAGALALAACALVLRRSFGRAPTAAQKYSVESD